MLHSPFNHISRTCVQNFSAFFRRKDSFYQNWLGTGRSFSSVATKRSPTTSHPRLPINGYVNLTSRRLLILYGDDAAHFLQGLVSANVSPKLAGNAHGSKSRRKGFSQSLYATFLNAQGRLLHDVFIYPLQPSSSLLHSGYAQGATKAESLTFLVEVDANEAEDLLRLLKRYRLRSKVKISLVSPDEILIFSAWRDGGSTSEDPSSPLDSEVVTELDSLGAFISRDDRAPTFGARVLLPASKLPSFTSSPAERVTAFGTSAEQCTLEQYTVRRYLNGIPEGQTELTRGEALAHESDIDYMLGIDFRKGCYIGQELVIRTQHTGVVRKRVVPCMLYGVDEAPPAELTFSGNASRNDEPTQGRIGDAQDGPAGLIPKGTDLMKVAPSGSGFQGRSVGKWIAGLGNLGLALCRLEGMAGLDPTGERVQSWTGKEEFGVKYDVSQDVENLENSQIRIRAFVPNWWAERRDKTRLV